jgi:hypothetical protein
MSKVKEAAPKGTEIPVEERLRSLFKLQKIDSKIDEIQVLKGELPMEVRDLEDEIEGLRTRTTKIEDELKEVETAIANHKLAQKEAETSIKKYQKQQANVKNNREYDALSKEIELQKLDIQLFDKRVKEAHAEIESKKEYLAECEKEIKAKEKDLKNKKADLENIIADTEAEEKALAKKSKEAESKIDERLITAYHRIRRSYRNGLAVVTVQRASCGGCFNAIPPQLQLEIRQHKKITLCEHCGRILVDEALGK